MKKLLFSVLVAFAAQNAMADVLSLTVTPIDTGVGARTKHIKLYSSGQVHLTYCEVTTGYCAPSMHLATLSWYAMNHINRMINQARFGFIADETPLCTAVPTENKNYMAGYGTVLLETGSYPCGTVRVNQSDAAYYLASVLKQYE